MNSIPTRAIRTTTALALASAIAISLLLTGADGASASPYIIVPIANQFTAQCSNGVAVPNPARNPGLVSDCATLLAAKDALEGADGSLNWSADVGISHWNGVTTTNNRVSELWLQKYDMNGAIPAELGNLAKLEELGLYDNQLTGEISPELGNLADLKFLYLSGNQLTGAIPPELGNLANLTQLGLNNNQLTGAIPPELGKLSNLEFLYLDENQLTGAIPAELGNLANLTLCGSTPIN